MIRVTAHQESIREVKLEEEFPGLLLGTVRVRKEILIYEEKPIAPIFRLPESIGMGVHTYKLNFTVKA